MDPIKCNEQGVPVMAKQLMFVLLSAIVILACTFSLSACSDSGSTMYDAADIDDNNVGIETEEENEEANVEIDWTYDVDEREDTDGYKYEISYQMSPWILVTDENMNMINSAWNLVGDGNELLGYDDWGISDGVRHKDGEGWFEHRSMTDMYYCIGTVTVDNQTEGWSISSDNPRSVGAGLQFFPGTDTWTFPTSEYQTQTSPQCITAAFYSSGEKTEAGTGSSLSVSALMESDSWGPLPFILMVPESISPNNPDGANIEALRGSKLGEISLDVYGQDGQLYEAY